MDIDMVESRLIFKQQCCVLVQFLKIARKQLVKFKSQVGDLGYDSISEFKRNFGNMQNVVFKEFKFIYDYT